MPTHSCAVLFLVLAVNSTIFTELHALTQVLCSYVLLMCYIYEMCTSPIRQGTKTIQTPSFLRLTQEDNIHVVKCCFYIAKTGQ